MREGAIEPTVVPRNPLDVLAQQIVAIAASAETRRRRRAARARRPRTHSYAELSPRAARERARHARRPLPLRRVRRAAAADRLGPPRRHDPRAQGRAAARDRQRRHDPRPRALRASRCPTAGASASSTRRWSTRRARADLPARRVRLADRGDRPRPRDRHARARRARRGAVLAGRLGSGARSELGEAIGAFSRWAVDQPPEALERDYDLDPLRRAQPARLPARAAGRDAACCPSDRTIVVERFRDEIGDWRLCVLSPFGGRVHAAWGLALSARIRERYGLESDAIWSDDGIIVHLPDADEPPTRRAGRCSSPRSSRSWSSASSAPRRCSARASARTPRARC